MQIRQGKVDPEEVLLRINHEQQITEQLMEKLPESVDIDILASQWLVPLKKTTLLNSGGHVMNPELFNSKNDFNLILKEKAEKVLQQNNQKGHILFCAPYGNTALLGTNKEPEDILAVFALPTCQTLNTLKPPPQVLVPLDGPVKPNDKHRRGIQLIEVETFLTQVLQANHVTTEPLFYPKNEIWSSLAWDSVLEGPSRDGASYLLGIGHMMHYFGNAESFLKRNNYKNEEETRKYHVMASKFVFQTEKLMNGGTPNLDFKPEELEILSGKIPPKKPEELLSKIGDLKKTIMKNNKNSKNDSAKDFLNEWLLSLRKSLL